MYQLLCRVNVPVSDGHLPDAASQLLDPVPARADSDHAWSTFWWVFDEDMLFTYLQLSWSFDVLTFLLRAMRSNRVLLTVVQQVDVLEEFSELYSCNEWNGASKDCRLDRSLTVTLHQACSLRSSCTMLHLFKHQLNADARVRTTHAHRPTHISTHIHYITTLHVDTVFRV